MGTYIPAEQNRKRSISDTLVEAEEEHFLDCPNADFGIRFAAALLDYIFLFLIHSALVRINRVVSGYFVDPSGAPLTIGIYTDSLAYLLSLMKVATVYAYFVWAVGNFGGTPGKLLLGLRILREDNGQKLSLGRIILREFLGKAISLVILGIGFILPLFRSDRRALHDLIAGTVVKRIHGDS